MKKKTVLGVALMMMPLVSSAGGYLTNTNQHAAFLRSLSRGATIDIDAALSNPAGLSFYPSDGFRVGVSIQSAFQTRDIDATFGIYNGVDPVEKKPVIGEYSKYYKGKAAAPVIPSVFAAYKKGDWVISGFFAITGGGGKASFDDGLPMFESTAMAGIFKESLKNYMQTGGKSPIAVPDMYTINSAMDGRQYIYSVQLGLGYKITDWLSAFAGGRMNYFSGNYDGYLDAKLRKEFGGVDLMNLALDCDQTGWGLTPVLGVDVKYGKFNFGAKYEFKTNLNIENNTKKLEYPNTDRIEELIGAYKHGVNTPNDIPAMLSVAASYQIIPTVRASVEYHFFDDKNAGMAGGKQKLLERGTNEYLMGVEWDIIKRLTISGGAQITDYGLSDEYQSDTSFSCDSYSLGFGAKIQLSPKAALNVGYMWTTYKDYTKTMDNYCGTGLPGQNVYSRTNKVFGLSLDYAF